MLNLYGAIFLLRKDIGLGGLENGNFPLLYVMKMFLRSLSYLSIYLINILEALV